MTGSLFGYTRATCNSQKCFVSWNMRKKNTKFRSVVTKSQKTLFFFILREQFSWGFFKHCSTDPYMHLRQAITSAFPYSTHIWRGTQSKQISKTVFLPAAMLSLRCTARSRAKKEEPGGLKSHKSIFSQQPAPGISALLLGEQDFGLCSKLQAPKTLSVLHRENQTVPNSLPYLQVLTQVHFWSPVC